ncbi:M48 family metallopeptidase [Desulfovibrio sp. OttesenSCG-928-O18]|nr:M48 family metallopeptidase [Desulfovibrio sp. OttesenSCG-928-O18]
MPETRPWPPPFAVRVSKKAKHARLRVLPGAGLEVVLPRGVDTKFATDIVEKHKEWVTKTLERICGSEREASPPAALPETVALHGGTLQLAVQYGSPRTSLAGETLCVSAPVEEKEKALSRLQDWAREYAQTTLGAETAHLAAQHGLPYSSLRFRRQKSRWGSCTIKGALSLNTCLIFLPSELARHIILHELAHTKHMNHGEGFWKLLFSMEENALALDKRLRKAWRHVPEWIWL